VIVEAEGWDMLGGWMSISLDKLVEPSLLQPFNIILSQIALATFLIWQLVLIEQQLVLACNYDQ
jgi:hypothetical protein